MFEKIPAFRVLLWLAFLGWFVAVEAFVFEVLTRKGKTGLGIVIEALVFLKRYLCVAFFAIFKRT